MVDLGRAEGVGIPSGRVREEGRGGTDRCERPRQVLLGRPARMEREGE